MNSTIKNHKIYFRLDCGKIIGYGHLSRCLAVAEEFSSRGIDPVFIIRKRPSTSVDIPFEVLWLKEAAEVTSLDTSNWKEGTEEAESDEVNSLLPSGSTIILDHYGLGFSWQTAIRKNGHQLIIFQDACEINYDACAIINYSFGAESQYSRKPDVKYLLGPEYTPLNKVYTNNHQIHFNENTAIKTVGIYLGGIKSEYIDLVSSALKNHPYFSDKKIEWVVNSNEEKDIVKTRLDKAIIHVKLPGLVDLYKRVELFIGTCGVASLERGCLGMWQMNFSVADNQASNVDALTEGKLGFYLGDVRKLSSDHLSSSLTQAINVGNQEKYARITKLFNLVDGQGASAIVDNLIGGC